MNSMVNFENVAAQEPAASISVGGGIPPTAQADENPASRSTSHGEDWYLISILVICSHPLDMLQSSP